MAEGCLVLQHVCVSSVELMSPTPRRELLQSQHGSQISGTSILRAYMQGAKLMHTAGTGMAPSFARQPLSVRARQSWQHVMQSHQQQVDSVAHKWSQLEARVITVVNSLALSTAGQVSAEHDSSLTLRQHSLLATFSQLDSNMFSSIHQHTCQDIQRSTS